MSALSSQTPAATSSTATTEGADLRLGITRAELGYYVGGAVLTLAFAYQAAQRGGTVSLGFLLGVGIFGAATYAFLAYPHVAVALTIPFFALLPAVKILVEPRLGPAKDAVVLAAGVAGLAAAIAKGRAGQPPIDRWLLTCAVLLFFLYAVNVAGPHDIAWFHGIRLFSEPVILLLAGLALPQPQRTLRWAVGSLIATGCLVAGIGLAQQGLGQFRLADLGFAYNEQIRTINGRLRSFGTMDEPFAYASFLLLAVAAALFGRRRTALSVGVTSVLLLGIGVSYVRTAILILFAFLALELARRRRFVVAGALAGTLVVLAFILLLQSHGTESRTFANANGSVAITLNGRTSAWKAALGSPSQWPFGRGVGEVGTAAERAGYALTVSPETRQRHTLAVDSGYFATIADVGVVGLIVLLALFTRAALLARDAVQRGASEGWLALAIIAALLIDALTRSSFSAFPSAFLEMFVLGIALNAAQDSDTAASTRWPRHSASD